MSQEKKELLEKHIRITKSDWQLIKKFQHKSLKSVSIGDVIHVAIINLEKTNKEDVIIEKLEKILMRLSATDKNVELGNELIGELCYIKDLQFVRHGVSKNLEETAMEFVDKKIKNAQERKAYRK
ncbi:hypothetical protein [Lactobacillus bombicola]|uniref:Uncharacterized protein n=1 Tax=Lactobacillus bombicola TaxID=1505723 RepID=A0A396SWP6_9LACO|nr:hypothetical protein [Lactobacillus bombicola]RHW55060.1 hypothetical protein DS835_01415 [Lactobacillus bombicola]